MRILPKPVELLWDKRNFIKNLSKHNVSVQEAEELFVNEPFTVAEDEKHSTDSEKRFRALGKTKTNRKLFTAFTIRDKKIRIISVRAMSKKEEAIYEKLEKDS